MCIIAVSKIGVRQPSLKQLRNMYTNNPHGAGYMYARNGIVHIHKGFMTWEDFERNIKAEAFTEADPVVYHFRISTQAGVKPTMTHPFPLTDDLSLCEALDVTCPVGLAHNGIISMTSFAKEVKYSDTAYFITRRIQTGLIRCICAPGWSRSQEHTSARRGARSVNYYSPNITATRFPVRKCTAQRCSRRCSYADVLRVNVR